MKMASVAPDGTPWAKALLQYKKKVAELSGGRIKMKLFIGGALGDENETVTACKRGRVQAIAVSTSAMATVVPELNILEMPYLFRDYAQADKALDNANVMRSVNKYLADRGFMLLFWSENGFRSFGTSFGFVKSPADIKSKKMRSQEVPTHIEFYKAIGASPVPIPVTEVLTSLQTGVVQGFDNTPLFSFASSWHTAVTHYSVTEHIYQPALIAVKKDWWDALKKEDQDILEAAKGDIPVKLRSTLRKMGPLLLKNFENAGIQVHRLTDGEKATFHAAAKVAREKYLSGASAEAKAFHATLVAAMGGR